MIDQDETSRFAPAGEDAWGAEADGARLRLVRTTAGRRRRDALARFTAATGRQGPPAAPWTFGPWFQTGQPNVVPVEEERAITKAQRDARRAGVGRRDADALPAVRRAREPRGRRARAHRLLPPRRPRAARLLQPAAVRVLLGGLRARGRGRRAPATARRRRRSPTRRSSAAPAPLGFTRSRSRSSTSPTRRPRTSTPGWCAEAVGHRRRRLDGGLRRVDAAGDRPARRLDRRGRAQPLPDRLPLRAAAHRRAASTARSCAISARAGRARRACADVVWGGDPTTVWGFDGLSSAVTQLLSIGLSRRLALGHRHRRLQLVRRRLGAPSRAPPRTRR